MTIPTIDSTSSQGTQSAKDQWINTLTDIVTVHAWRDPVVEANPHATPTNSDETMITGRVRIFVSCECLSGGAS